MKKYVWKYITKTIEIENTNIGLLCDEINELEKLEDKHKINKWNVFNYYQNKIKNPRPMMLNIIRTAL
tara:strand:+ start:1301 stop:1504 length:204 start_codon:yes stop_codon:yes gene_type:complete